MPRTAVTKTFSLRQDELERFERLVKRVADGSTTEFIRRAMDQMEALENWQQFESIQEVGVRRARARGITSADQRRQAIRNILNQPSEDSG